MTDKNNWFKKYLGFFAVSNSDPRTTDDIIISKLKGKKTTLNVSINMNTLYAVLTTKFKNDNVKIYISEDKDLVSVSSDSLSIINELFEKYGGSIDDTYIYDYKYTLQIFEHSINEDYKINASI